MKNVLLVGNIWFLFFFIGFLLFTSPNPTILNKYAPSYFLGIIALLFVAIPYNVVLVILIYDKAKLTINKKPIKLHLFYRILLVVLLVFILCVCTELFLRMYPKPKMEDYHPFLQAMTSQKADKEYQVNSDNFRYPQITREKPADTYRIFITGGSTVFDEWHSYEQNVVRKIEIILQKHYPDKKIQVINAGYNRYTSEHSLILYQTKLADYDPDLLVIWQGFNDMYYSCDPYYLTSGRYTSDYGHFYGVHAKMVNEYFQGYKTSYLLSMMVKAFQEKFYADVRQFIPLPSTQPERIPQDMTFQSLSAYKRNMTYLTKSVKSDNVAMLLGNQPTIYNLSLTDKNNLTQGFCFKDSKYPSMASLIKGINSFNEISKKIAQENNIAFVDLDKKLPKTSEYFTDDVHYTDKGNQVIADSVADAIIRNAFLE